MVLAENCLKFLEKEITNELQNESNHAVGTRCHLFHPRDDLSLFGSARYSVVVGQLVELY